MEMPNPPIELLVRGDDAGGSISANRAIAQGHREGVITNVSIMANGDALDDAAERFAQFPRLCIGLHVSLNSEWIYPRFRPVLPSVKVPSLVGADGCFLASPNDLVSRGFSLDEAESEVRVQLDRLRASGLQPAYMDEHMLVGNAGGLTDRLARICEREGLIYARHNANYLPPLKSPSSPTNDVSARVSSWMTRIESAPPGRYVLVTHPLNDDEESRAIYRASNPPGQVAANRDCDRRSIIDPAMVALCRSPRVRLIRYIDRSELPV